MRVFLDANILFSAADPTSATRELLERVGRAAELVSSPHAWEETRRNLALKRPKLVPHLSDLAKRVHLTSAFAEVSGVHLPPQDVPILAGAVGAECTHLWTSDKAHFGALYGKSIRGVKVVSSIQMLDEL